ncbi:SDR family oxidoreductase [Streptomyces thermolilacinus]
MISPCRSPPSLPGAPPRRVCRAHRGVPARARPSVSPPSTPTPVRQTAGELADTGHRALVLVCDVTDEDRAAAAADGAVETFGRLARRTPTRASCPPPADAADENADRFDRVRRQSARRPREREARTAPHARAGRRGDRQLLPPPGGLVAKPGRAAYHTTKHGVIGPTRSAALERGSPAPVPRRLPRRHRHPMVDATAEGGGLDRAQAETGQAIDRPGAAEEVAQAVLCPCGPGYVTGIALAGRRRLHRPAAAPAFPAGRGAAGIRPRRVRAARRSRGATPWAAPRERRRRISREGYDQRPMVGDLPGVVGVGWRVPVVQN